MRKIHYSLFAVFAMFFITSGTIKQEEPKRLFEKIVFVELSSDEDSVLFIPLSKAWNERWNRSSDLQVNGAELMNYESYKFSFNERNDNLWTILHPMIIDGTIYPYFPNDPESYGMGHSDDGELRYPIIGQDENETFVSSETMREKLCNVLGQLGPESDIPLIDDWGDPLIVTAADGTQMFAYPPPDFYWYNDEDIVKYKLRVSVLMNKKGKEKKRVIKSISPVVNRMSETGEINGEKELLWLNFEELKPVLEESYYFDEDLKSTSYLDYFLQKVKNANLLKAK